MNKPLFVGLMLVLAFVLSACGGDEPSDSDLPAEGTSGAAETATATAEPATATPVEPTATPEPSPTPTLAPTPTEIMEETPSESDQNTTGSGGTTAGSGWGESDSGSQSACDHPYLPLRPGATWTYEASDGQRTWEVVDVQGDMNEATAVVKVTAGDITLDYHWQCSAGEGLSSFDFASLAATPVGLELTLEQVSIEGEFLLPPEELVPGASWTTVMESNIAFSQELEGSSIEATGNMTTVQENTVLGDSPVEFNGQTISALQLEQISNLTMTLLMMGASTEETIILGSNFDLGYGIGIVSQSTTTDFGDEIMNLIEYSIP